MAAVTLLSCTKKAVMAGAALEPVLPCVAVCCSVLQQCVAVCCSVLQQCVAVCCGVTRFRPEPLPSAKETFWAVLEPHTLMQHSTSRK